jgi:hypothetical protein
MLIRLTRKLANQLDGVDVTDHEAGDILDLPSSEARLLIAEEWAAPHRDQARRDVRQTTIAPVRAVAADAQSQARAIAQARRLHRQMEKHSFEALDHRRADDRIREQLHDAQVKPIR